MPHDVQQLRLQSSLMDDVRNETKTRTIRDRRRDDYELGVLEFVNASDPSDRELVMVHTISFMYAYRLDQDYFNKLKKYYPTLEGMDQLTTFDFELL